MGINELIKRIQDAGNCQSVEFWPPPNGCSPKLWACAARYQRARYGVEYHDTAVGETPESAAASWLEEHERRLTASHYQPRRAAGLEE